MATAAAYGARRSAAYTALTANAASLISLLSLDVAPMTQTPHASADQHATEAIEFAGRALTAALAHLQPEEKTE